jgi:hypothetical protein
LRIIKKKDYVSSRISDYAEQKRSFADKAVKEKINDIINQNEKDGFIFIWNRWLTLENVVDVLITHIIDSSNRKTLDPIFEVEKKKIEDDSTEDDAESEV